MDYKYEILNLLRRVNEHFPHLMREFDIVYSYLRDDVSESELQAESLRWLDKYLDTGKNYISLQDQNEKYVVHAILAAVVWMGHAKKLVCFHPNVTTAISHAHTAISNAIYSKDLAEVDGR